MREKGMVIAMDTECGEGGFSHVPVMPDECIRLLNIRPDGVYFDCTAGGGGHSSLIAMRLSAKGTLVCIDQNKEAVSACRERLRGFECAVEIVRDNFRNLGAILDRLAPGGADGFLFDCGVSSFQLDTAEQGFSYRLDGPLCMRMSDDNPLTAETLVNETDKNSLARLLRNYGEEPFAGRIASAICEFREDARITTTLRLAEIIKTAVPNAARRDAHPAKRTFQALRIAVNDELGALQTALAAAAEGLKSGGRIVTLDFHSLEDRIIKDTFAELSRSCVCPHESPVCVCGGKPRFTKPVKKPLTAGEKELAVNRRSHSAKLRALEKL